MDKVNSVQVFQFGRKAFEVQNNFAEYQLILQLMTENTEDQFIKKDNLNIKSLIAELYNVLKCLISYKYEINFQPYSVNIILCIVIGRNSIIENTIYDMK